MSAKQTDSRWQLDRRVLTFSVYDVDIFFKFRTSVSCPRGSALAQVFRLGVGTGQETRLMRSVMKKSEHCIFDFEGASVVFNAREAERRKFLTMLGSTERECWIRRVLYRV